MQQVKVEHQAPRRKRRPRQGRLRAISELAAAASGCKAEGVNDPVDFIECQLGVIMIARATAIFFDSGINSRIMTACTGDCCSFRNICKIARSFEIYEYLTLYLTLASSKQQKSGN